METKEKVMNESTVRPSFIFGFKYKGFKSQYLGSKALNEIEYCVVIAPTKEKAVEGLNACFGNILGKIVLSVDLRTIDIHALNLLMKDIVKIARQTIIEYVPLMNRWTIRKYLSHTGVKIEDLVSVMDVEVVTFVGKNVGEIVMPLRSIVNYLRESHPESSSVRCTNQKLYIDDDSVEDLRSVMCSMTEILKSLNVFIFDSSVPITVIEKFASMIYDERITHHFQFMYYQNGNIYDTSIVLDENKNQVGVAFTSGKKLDMTKLEVMK